MDLPSLLDLHIATPWVFAGAMLLIVEILASFGLFLSFSAAAFLVAAVLFFGWGAALSDWQIIALFAALGAILIYPVRYVLRRRIDRTPDINQY